MHRASTRMQSKASQTPGNLIDLGKFMNRYQSDGFP